jgi:hypothetical protein
VRRLIERFQEPTAPSSACKSSILNMEAVGSSETSVPFYQTAAPRPRKNSNVVTAVRTITLKYEVLHYEIRSFILLYLLFRKSRHSPLQHYILRYLQTIFLLWRERPNLYPFKTTGKIKNPCIFRQQTKKHINTPVLFLYRHFPWCVYYYNLNVLSDAKLIHHLRHLVVFMLLGKHNF